MAHEIDRMAYFGATPWHKLGTRTPEAMTASAALTLGGLDFTVEKRPVFTGPADASYGARLIPDSFATVRTDRETVLGVVGSKYTPLQNPHAFAFFDAFVAQDEAVYHTVGSLRGGRQVWILAKLPGEIRIKGEDIAEKYLLLTNSHDGSSGVQILLTPIRVVCANTLRAALNGGKGTSFNIRHLAGVQAAVAQASQVMGIANAYYADLQDAFQAMAAAPLADKNARSYLERCLRINAADEENSTRTKNILEEATRNLWQGRGQDLPGVRGTVWGAYNALTEFVDHRKYRSDDVALDNAWFNGSGQATKQRAFDLALELAR